MSVNDKRKFNRFSKKHRGHPGAPPEQRMTKEGYQRRRQWLQDHHEKLLRLLRDS